MADEPNAGRRPMSRRDALKTAGLAGAAALSTAAVASAQVKEETATAKNPYGGVPSGGITLPPYYRPTPYLKSNNIYFPGQEEIGPDEMRVSFIGSTPMPVTRAQAGTCIMVELGMASGSSLTWARAAFATSSRWASRCRWSMTSSSLTCMWITMQTCHTSMLSPRGSDVGSRCACTGHPAARLRTAPRR